MDNARLEDRIFTYSEYLKKKYNRKVFRIGLSIGKTCPHRLHNGGCIFCNPKAFTGDYQWNSLPINEQIHQAKEKIQKTCKATKLLAYFQDETSTACAIDELKHIFNETLNHKDIIGIILSTRPDFISDEFIAYFATLQVPFTLEIGLQTIHEKSLLFLNRGHTFELCDSIIKKCGKAGIEIGVHVILGIPGETFEEMKQTIQHISNNSFIKQVKFHNLVIYKETELYNIHEHEKIPIYSIEEHIANVAKLLPYLRGDIAVTRLFTSNILNTQPTAVEYHGNKTKWMNQLRLEMIHQNIFQGMFTEVPYKSLSKVV
jgi:radical SAM protein (TIGR01212 family)